MGNSILVATRKGLFTVVWRGNRWEIDKVAFLGVPVSSVLQQTPGGALHAALDHGHFGVKLHRSNDGGATWKERAVPSYPEKPEGEPDLDAIRKEPIPWDLKMIWSLEGGHRDAPDTLWCGTMPGGLFRSDDSGDSWRLVETLWNHPSRKKWFGGGADYPGIHSIVIDADDANTLSIAVSCGGIWTSHDTGATWECRSHGMRAEYMPPEQSSDPEIQDVHRLVQCAGHPQHWWAQHHNGIFYSNNKGERWQEIKNVEPSVFGFTVAVDPHDPGCAWFVPAEKDEQRSPVNGQVVVTHTGDGGKSFQVFRNGLPQEHAYDIVFRHALDIDTSGQRLAFGSTTGSLWISNNRGDSWQNVCPHLPPIYAVRFIDL